MILPLVSIILPVWNPNPDWLEVAIDSAFNESSCKIEVILVDDGSDEPPDVWLSAHNAERVRMIRTSHRGVSHASNVGIIHCRGDYIRFVAGDDVILPESTSTLVKLIDNDNSVVTYGSTVTCDQYLQPNGIIRSSLGGKIHLQTVLGRFTCMIPAMLMPRWIVNQVDGFDDHLFVQVDWDFVLRVSEVADFRGMRCPVYLYRMHKNSLSGNRVSYKEAIRSTELIINGYLARHPELHGTRIERRVRAYAHFLTAKLQNPNFPMINHLFWRASAVDPIRGAVIASMRTIALGKKAVKSMIPKFRH
jgi:glycosyltransferase involved in cell wall biosynthesis